MAKLVDKTGRWPYTAWAAYEAASVKEDKEDAVAGEGNSSLIGRRLGNYELVKLLGTGGMAEVYLAHDLELNRSVAVKVMLDELKREPEFERRFRSEATQVANLRHPHIIPIYAAGASDDGLLYMVMPVVPDSLRYRMEQQPPLSLDESARLAKEVAEALTAAHQVGLIHRDVKPENVLLDEHNQALLTDFGIARKVEPSDRSQRPAMPTLSATGLPIGTPEYMAPEQLLGEPLDQRADIYSLGAVLYEMLTGHLPHIGDTPYAVAAQTLTGPVVPPSQHNPHIWPALEAVVLQAMASSRDQRYPTAAAFSSALAEAMVTREMTGRPTFIPGADVTNRPTAVPAASGGGGSNALTVGAVGIWGAPTMPARGNKRGWWWLAMLAILLLGIGGLSLGNLLNQPHSTGTARLIATGTATARATTSPTLSATSTAKAIAAAATSTAAAHIKPTAVPPTATRPAPTATPTPVLNLSSKVLQLSYNSGRHSTCTGNITINNSSSSDQVSWQWTSSQGVQTNWTFKIIQNGTTLSSFTGAWPSNPSGIPAGESDKVYLTISLATSSCVSAPYNVTMTDGNGVNYQFKIT